MPLRDFDGDTFVAFIDISGFKDLMKQERAVKAMDRFYSSGYRVLQQINDVQGLFISDCGILIAPVSRNKIVDLELLLTAIQKINRDMLDSGFMLTTSISYGKFSYHHRIEFSGIEKNPIYGNGYVSAFLDNENGNPRIQPGQCRILKDKCPIDIDEIQVPNNILSLVQARSGDRQHYYFYWMVDDQSSIAHFEQEYKDSYNLKYSGMLIALQGGNGTQMNTRI